MSKPVKSGKTLETLVTYIEKALANKEQVTVDTRKRLPDRTTGRLREHDVVLTLTQGHHEIVIAIECRDLSRRITVNQVESFWAKCQHTGVAHGIMVSSKGFYRSARQKATHLGIRCLDLEEAAAFDWLVGQGITVGYRILKHSHWTYLLERVPEGSIAEFRLVTTEGEEILPDVLQANLVRRHTEPVDMAYEPPSRQRFESGDSPELAQGLPYKGKSMRNRGVSSPMPFLLIPRSLLRGGFIEPVCFNQEILLSLLRGYRGHHAHRGGTLTTQRSARSPRRVAPQSHASPEPLLRGARAVASA